jgi:hypothetical protein
MANKEQSETNAFLSELKIKLHAYHSHRNQANTSFDNYVKNRKAPHFTPSDTAKLKSIAYLSEIEYQHAMYIVDEVERFFNQDN